MLFRSKRMIVFVDDAPVSFVERSVGTETYTASGVSVTNAATQVRVMLLARHAQHQTYVWATQDAGGASDTPFRSKGILNRARGGIIP